MLAGLSRMIDEWAIFSKIFFVDRREKASWGRSISSTNLSENSVLITSTSTRDKTRGRSTATTAIFLDVLRLESLVHDVHHFGA